MLTQYYWFWLNKGKTIEILLMSIVTPINKDQNTLPEANIFNITIFNNIFFLTFLIFVNSSFTKENCVKTEHLATKYPPLYHEIFALEDSVHILNALNAFDKIQNLRQIIFLFRAL